MLLFAFVATAVVVAQADTVLKRFDLSSIDAVLADWDPMIWNPGHVNHELQYYTKNSDNLYVSNGELVIRAKKESDGKYTSARLHSKQRFSPLDVGNKKIRIEYTAQVPSYQGAWPALWMVGDSSTYGGWPACGEVDVMEWVYAISTHTEQSLHWKSGSDYGQQNLIFPNPAAIRDWHTYRVDLCAQPGNEYVQFSVDDTWYKEQRSSLWSSTWHGCGTTSNDRCSGLAPFDNEMTLILNVAVGGDWGGSGVHNYDAFNGDGVAMTIRDVTVWELS